RHGVHPARPPRLARPPRTHPLAPAARRSDPTQFRPLPLHACRTTTHSSRLAIATAFADRQRPYVVAGTRRDADYPAATRPRTARRHPGPRPPHRRLLTVNTQGILQNITGTRMVVPSMFRFCSRGVHAHAQTTRAADVHPRADERKRHPALL